MEYAAADALRSRPEPLERQEQAAMMEWLPFVVFYAVCAVLVVWKVRS